MSHGPGFVYVMRSPAVTWAKIGLSVRAPHFRARELTVDPVYGGIGPWEVVDYRQVVDMRETELALHRHFASRNVAFTTATELFDVPVAEAVERLVAVAGADLVRGDLIGRMRLEPDFVAYLQALFGATGLVQFLDLQESWTFSLFPSTAGGRHFTINVDRHEVAYAADLSDGMFVFMLHLDRRCLDRSSIRSWLRTRHGVIRGSGYSSGLAEGASIEWKGSMGDAGTIFDVPMVRRALIAYWYDRLLTLRDRGKRSLFARFHNHNAVQDLVSTMPGAHLAAVLR